MQTSEKKKAVADSSCYCNSSIFWSEWRGSNPRPDGPKPSALSTAPHPDFYSVVVKHVVKGVFSVFRRYRRLPKNPGISTIFGGRIFPVQTCGYTLPKQTRCQLRCTPIFFLLRSGLKSWRPVAFLLRSPDSFFPDSFFIIINNGRFVKSILSRRVFVLFVLFVLLFFVLFLPCSLFCSLSCSFDLLILPFSVVLQSRSWYNYSEVVLC